MKPSGLACLPRACISGDELLATPITADLLDLCGLVQAVSLRLLLFALRCFSNIVTLS